jgi:hypothetical protein
MEKKEFNIGDYNFNEIFFLKQKNNYKIYIRNKKNNEKIKIISPLLKIPFGSEKYQGKEIINLELSNYKSDNNIYNFFSLIKSIDNFFEKISWSDFIKNNLQNKISEDLLNDLKNKKYISCLKNRPNNFDPLLRTHLRHKKNVNSKFFKIENSIQKIISSNDLKNESGNFVIELDFLWTTKTNYGICFYINAAKLI